MLIHAEQFCLQGYWFREGEKEADYVLLTEIILFRKIFLKAKHIQKYKHPKAIHLINFQSRFAQLKYYTSLQNPVEYKSQDVMLFDSRPVEVVGLFTWQDKINCFITSSHDIGKLDKIG